MDFTAALCFAAAKVSRRLASLLAGVLDSKMADSPRDGISVSYVTPGAESDSTGRKADGRRSQMHVDLTRARASRMSLRQHPARSAMTRFSRWPSGDTGIHE